MKKQISFSFSLPQLLTFIFIIFLASFLLFSFRPTQTSSTSLQESLHDTLALVSPSVVMLVDEKGVMGAGILVDKTTVLTSKHLLERGKKYGVRFADDTIVWGTVRSLHPTLDLALLTVQEGHKGTYARIISSQAHTKIGDFVLAFGVLPTGPSFIEHFGIISQMNQSIRVDDQYFSGQILTDIPFHAGYSGGPLVNMKGEIIAINTAFLSQGSVGWSTPLDTHMLTEWLGSVDA